MLDLMKANRLAQTGSNWRLAGPKRGLQLDATAFTTAQAKLKSEGLALSRRLPAINCAIELDL
jgi:hypothetical protein